MRVMIEAPSGYVLASSDLKGTLERKYKATIIENRKEPYFTVEVNTLGIDDLFKLVVKTYYNLRQYANLQLIKISNYDYIINFKELDPYRKDNFDFVEFVPMVFDEPRIMEVLTDVLEIDKRKYTIDGRFVIFTSKSSFLELTGLMKVYKVYIDFKPNENTLRELEWADVSFKYNKKFPEHILVDWKDRKKFERIAKDNRR